MNTLCRFRPQRVSPAQPFYGRWGNGHLAAGGGGYRYPSVRFAGRRKRSAGSLAPEHFAHCAPVDGGFSTSLEKSASVNNC